MCFFQFPAGAGNVRLSENNFAICKLKECDVEVNEEE